MKIEIGKEFPQYFKPSYPEEFELFSHFEVTAGIPTVLFAITTWKENGQPNVCFHSWSCFHGDKTAFFAVMGNLYQHTHPTCPWPLSSALILFPADNPEKILTCYQKNGMVKTVIRLTDLSGIDHGKYNAIISRPSGHFHGCPDRGLFSMEKTAFRNRVKATYHRMKTEKRRKTHENGITGTGTEEQFLSWKRHCNRKNCGWKEGGSRIFHHGTQREQP